MNEKVIRIDLIKNLQEVLSSIEGICQALFALDDELSQGVKIERDDLFYATLSLAADVERAKRIASKLKVYQRRAGGVKDAAD